MRFSVRNLVMWTSFAAGVFAIAQLIGLFPATLIGCFALFVAVQYDEGVRSAGIPSNRASQFFSDVAPLRKTSSTTAPLESLRGPRPKRASAGPALYLISFGFIGMFFGGMLVRPNHVPTYFLPFLGFILGGTVFRIRSQKWATDPFAGRRMAVYVAITVVICLAFPIVIFASPTLILIGGMMSFSISTGILIAGPKRDLLMT